MFNVACLIPGCVTREPDRDVNISGRDLGKFLEMEGPKLIQHISLLWDDVHHVWGLRHLWNTKIGGVPVLRWSTQPCCGLQQGLHILVVKDPPSKCWGYAIFRQGHLWMDLYFEAFFQSVFCKFFIVKSPQEDSGGHCSKLRSPYTCGCWKPLPWARRCDIDGMAEVWKTGVHTVDGRNPAPVGRWFIPTAIPFFTVFHGYLMVTNCCWISSTIVGWVGSWMRGSGGLCIGFMGPKASFPVVSLGVRILSPNKSYRVAFPDRFDKNTT